MGKYSKPVTYTRKQGKSSAQASEPATKKEYAPLDWTRVDVAAMIERHTSTKLSGKGHHTQLVGACPFDDCTSDTDGFIVWPNGSNRSTDKSVIHYYCRACPEDRRSGDLIKLLRLLYPDWTFQRTLIEIGMRDEEGNETQGPPVEPRAASDSVWLSEQLEMLQGYYHDTQIALAKYERPQLYLLTRGISLDDARAYGIGYFPTIEETRRKADDPHVARWAGRLLFPLSGPRSSSLTFEGRTLMLWQEGMTPEQHKRAIEQHNATHEDRIERVLKTSPCGNFGYAEAMKESHVSVCEGPCDALSLLLAGVSGVVAMGTSLSAKSIPLSVERVTLALDADKAGNDAAYRLASGLADRGIEVQTVLPATGKDWNDMHVSSGLAAIKKAFRSPVQKAAPVAAHAIEEAETPDTTSEEVSEIVSCSYPDCAEEAQHYYVASVDSEDAIPYCSAHYPTEPVSEDRTPDAGQGGVYGVPLSQIVPHSEGMSLEQYAHSVALLASVLGSGVKIERVDPTETMTEYLERVYEVQGIPVSGPDDYSSLKPVEKRVSCPALVSTEVIKKDGKQYIKVMKAIPCSGSLAANGWCPEHRYNALLLELGRELAYARIELDALIIGETLVGWEAYAEVASPRSLKRILPIVKRMVDKKKAERASEPRTHVA